MKKKKNKVAIIVIIVVLVLVSIILYFLLNSRNKNNLSLEESKWLDQNKYNVIDIAVINDIPILSYDGDGILYDYLNYVNKNLSLQFNVVTYKIDTDVNYNYKLNVIDNPSDTDIVLLEDNLVLVTTNNTRYKDLSDIKDLKIGILSSDKSRLSDYYSLNNIEYVDYNSYSDLKSALVGDSTEINQGDIDSSTTLNAIIIPKLLFTKEVIENNYSISFHFNDLKKYFVLTTAGSKELNSILRKTYSTWKDNEYVDKYNETLLDNYFVFKNISDIDRKTLNSKNYGYGFIDYGIYNHIENKEISGLSRIVLEKFNEFSGISIDYTQYKSINKLLDAFNTRKVDFILNIADSEKYQNEIYNTVGVFNKSLAIVSGVNNKYVIDGLTSLKNKEVLVLKDSYQEKSLIDIGAKVKSYNNLGDLIKDFNVNDVTVMDLDNYSFYNSSSLSDSKINYLVNSNEMYNYVINDDESNKVFKELFNFFLSYTSINDIISNNYSDIASNSSNIQYILIIVILALLLYVVLDFSNHIKVMIKRIKKNKQVHLSKEDKIKYIDQLTSLKNRAYLNSKIEQWDDSEVYPQAIIIIDLNNISYINDNYGREEGDKVITEAANIFIQNQLQNSEIIRTDGNEFLIYLVGYSEKQIISYIRKLNKELKALSHGFGAAAGYSIITDAIKTIDDAVNEATIDMKNNKEDIDY